MTAGGSTLAPFKIGVLDEGLRAFDARVVDVIRFRCEEATRDGVLDRPVDVVTARGVGLPSGTARAVQDAWQELADAGCLVIIGPGVTDNCIAVVDQFESQKVPTINFPGTIHSRGQYGFHYQVGSLRDDGPIIVKALQRRGLRTVAVIRDRSPIGVEYFENFEMECDRVGVTISGDVKISPVATDLTAAVQAARAAGAEALAYLGFGGVLVDLSRALLDARWDPPRFTTSAGMHFHTKGDDDRRAMSGWVYIDQVDESNAALIDMQDRWEARFGVRPFNVLMMGAYDMATLAVLGIRYATVHTPHGVMEGLQRISQVPSTIGGAGTVMGFSVWERTALKGPNYLLLRQMSGTESIRYTL